MIQIHLEKNYYLRNPEETELGRKILSSSIAMLDKIGLEEFTFRKLAAEIGSTEASIYRYFESKHRLLVYLVAWHWRWLEYLIDYHTHNLAGPREKLEVILRLLARQGADTGQVPHMPSDVLFRIVISESTKAYFHKEVDDENKGGLFLHYKSLTRHIAALISEMNPEYIFPRALASTMIEASHQQPFFAEHLPGLTEVRNDGAQDNSLENFLRLLLFGQIGNSPD